MNQMLSKYFLVLVLFLSPFVFLGCESEEDNKMAGAQECLDKLKESDSNAQARACMSKIDGITSAQSYVIRCAINFFLGGVKSSTLLTVFTNYENQPENQKASYLMDAIALSDPDAPADDTASLAHAKTTYAACEASQVTSLQFIAASSLSGTLIKRSGAGDAGTVTDNLNKCINGGSGGVCDDEAVGQAVVSMYNVYCTGEATSDQVCTEIRSAINLAGGAGNAEEVAKQLYALLVP